MRACAPICTLYKHITQSTQIYTSSSKKHFDSLTVEVRNTPLHNRGFAHLWDLITICGTGIFTICSSSPGFPTCTKYSSWSIVCACFSTTLFQSWIHSMKSLHGLAQIALHWTEGWTKGLPVRSRGWLNSRIPLVCSSQHVAYVWTVWFPLSAPVARAVVTMSVSEWSDALWGHGQPNS